MTHDLSTAKFSTLERARSSYQAAAYSLPLTDNDPKVENIDENCSSYTNPLSLDKSEIRARSSNGPNVSPLPATASSPSPMDSKGVHQYEYEVSLVPSPLWIGRDSDDTSRLLLIPAPRSSHHTSSQCHSLPLSSTSRPFSVTFPTSTSAWLEVRTRDRNNAHLTSFAGMIAKNIADIDTLIKATYEAQTARYTVKRQISDGDDEDSKRAVLMTNIARMKAAGWKRERFAPEKYQELCAMALAEL